MKKISSLLTKNYGFTLLEVVITLIVGSILGTILVQFMGTSMKNSFQPVAMVQDGCGVYEIMEKLNSDYKMRLMTKADPLEDFKSAVEIGNLPASIPYYFGDYTYSTDYIVFDNSDDEVSDTTELRILKVKITYGGQTLTALFTR